MTEHELDESVTVVCTTAVNDYQLARDARDRVIARLGHDNRLLATVVGQDVLGRDDDQPHAVEEVQRAAVADCLLEQLAGAVKDATAREILADAFQTRHGKLALVVAIVPTDHPLTHTARITPDDEEG